MSRHAGRSRPARFAFVVLVLMVAAGAAHAGQSTLCGDRDDARLERGGFLGLMIGQVPDSVRAGAGIEDGAGVWIRQAIPGASADAAGIAPEGIVLSMNGAPVTGVTSFISAVRALREGDEAVLSVWRDGAIGDEVIPVLPMPRAESDTFDIVYGHVSNERGRYRTIVTVPPGEGPFPTVMLVQGLGCFSIETPITSDSTSETILYELTRRGYATVRVDKPGMGDSEGGPCRDVDFLTELEVYRLVFESLVECDAVDADRVFLFGTSMGGVMAPLIIGDRPTRGVAVYGTVLRNWMEYELENDRRQALLNGGTHADADDDARDRQLFLSLLYVQGWSLDKIIDTHPRFAEAVPDAPYMYGKHHRYFQQIYGTNLAREWERTQTSVLAIWGTSDFVSDGADHAMLADLVNARRPGHGRYYELRGVDHWMQSAETPAKSREIGPGGGEFDSAIIDVLDTWMQSTMTSEAATNDAG